MQQGCQGLLRIVPSVGSSDLSPKSGLLYLPAYLPTLLPSTRYCTALHLRLCSSAPSDLCTSLSIHPSILASDQLAAEHSLGHPGLPHRTRPAEQAKTLQTRSCHGRRLVIDARSSHPILRFHASLCRTIITTGTARFFPPASVQHRVHLQTFPASPSPAALSISNPAGSPIVETCAGSSRRGRRAFKPAQEEEEIAPLPHHLPPLATILPSRYEHRRPREFQNRRLGQAPSFGSQYTS